MSERSDYKPGEFCWVDLATPDLDASAGFYGELIDWERDQLGDSEEAHGYSNFIYKGKAVAGVGTLMMEGQPPAWSSYVNVADADETAAKVKEAGGNVMMDPFDVPGGSGRMTVCQDAEDAFFSIWQAGAFKGAELVNEVGSWTWNNLVSRDLEKAKGFYGDVFGWTLEKAEGVPPDLPFFNWQVEGQKWEEGLAGAVDAGAEGSGLPPEVPPHWQVYFAVEDAQNAIDATNSAGGKTYVGPVETPVAKLGVLDDPQGAGFGIIEPNYPEDR
jgi:predicted enzyme related to lactoylglutathione lyase